MTGRKEHLETFDRTKLTIVTADTQTGGRGRYGRKWVSPVGENIYTSFCFFINEDQEDPLSLTHLLAISIARVLENRGVSAQIKWPNDVLVSEKKLREFYVKLNTWLPILASSLA